MSMEVFHKYDSDVKQWVKSLSWWQSVLYCHAVCLRSGTLYFDFTANSRWGDGDCLIHAQCLSRDFLFGSRPNPTAVDTAYIRLEESLLGSDEFPDSSAAFEAGVIHLHTLSLLKKADPQETYHVAICCYNLVDTAAGDEVVPAGIMTAEHETAIGSHRFVQAEIQWQASARTLLKGVPDGDQVFAQRFIDEWTIEPILRKTAANEVIA